MPKHRNKRRQQDPKVTPTTSIQQNHNQQVSEVTEHQDDFHGRPFKPDAIFQAYQRHKILKRNETASNNETITVNGLVCKREQQWLAIKYIGDELVSVSPDGTLFLFDPSSNEVRWSISTGEPLHVSYQSLENDYPSIVFSGGSRRVYMRTKESEPKDLGCHAREFVADPYIYLNGLIIVHTRSVTKMHVNLGTGQRISPSTSDSSSDEILCISRFDYQLTCYKPGTDLVLWYRRIATFNIRIVSRDGARLHELNDASARIGKTLIKPGTIGKISWSNIEIGKGGKNKVLVEGEYQQPAVILCIEKGQSADDAVKKEVSIVNDNHTFIKVYGVVSDRDLNYFATEYCDTSLRDFIVSFYETSQHLKDYDKLLKLIWEIVNALAWLHRKEISHGNLNLDSIFVDICCRPKILAISLSKDTTVDMLTLGHVIFFCFTSHEYKDENLTKPKPSVPYLKPIYDCPDALDLLRKLLDKNPVQRATALQACNHTLFWHPSKNLRYIRDVSDYLELDGSPLRATIENIKEAVFVKSWEKDLPAEFLEVMKDESYGSVRKDGSAKKHSYDYSSSYSLLRIIRDLLTHEKKIRRQIEKVRKGKEMLEMFGSAGFGSYFKTKYPKLVNEVYNVMRKHLEGETKFLEYYKQSPF